MKKVLVSGAGGFVGARIMAQLAGRYELRAFPKGMLAAADETAVAELVWHEQPDVILHTAAISDTGYSEKHPEESYRANVQLPLWVARAAQTVGAKLVCFSSDQVYAGLTDIGRLPRIRRSPLPTSMAATSWKPNSACWMPARCCAAACYLDVRSARVWLADPRKFSAEPVQCGFGTAAHCGSPAVTTAALPTCARPWSS